MSSWSLYNSSFPFPYPAFTASSFITSSTLSSSIVGGTSYGQFSRILLRIDRRILPLLVLGSFSTLSTDWKAATGPISFLIKVISYFQRFFTSIQGLATTNATGISPLSESTFPTTAASITFPDFISTSSIAAVDSLWPAVFMISSRRVSTLRQPSESKQPASPVVQYPGAGFRYFQRKASSLPQIVLMKDGGMGSLTHIFPRVPTETCLFSASSTSMMNPGPGLVALPGFEGKVCKFLQLHERIHPIQVCQQWSLTRECGMREAIHSQVGMSQRSPAMLMHLTEERLYFLDHSPVKSSFRMALRAVGAIYSPVTLYFYIIYHTAPGCGVVGLPSQMIVLPPASRGPQTPKVWPTTHPMSLRERKVSPGWRPTLQVQVHWTATAVPPWSLTMPLGFPVVPEVQSIQRQSVEAMGQHGTKEYQMTQGSNSRKEAGIRIGCSGRWQTSTLGFYTCTISKPSFIIQIYDTTFLGSRPQLAARITLGLQSSILLASSLAAKPPKTTEWTTPSRAQASMLKMAWGIMGMNMMAVSPFLRP